jgi:hypothetical protein
MDVIDITDRLLVVRWIMNSDSNHKIELLRGWMKGRLHCASFRVKKVPIGWALFHFYDMNRMFVDYLKVGGGNVKAVFKAAIRHYDVDKIRMMSTRPKAWGRLMGFEPVGTIMEKEIMDEDLQQSCNKDINGGDR